MSNEKFSPGPWTYDGGFTVFSADGEPVCDLVSEAEINGEMRILPYEDNAALIETSPVMYAILKAVARILQEKECPDVVMLMRSVALLTDIVLKHVRGENNERAECKTGSCKKYTNQERQNDGLCN